MIPLGVKCYSGDRGEETPRSMVIHGKEIHVNELIDSWLAPDHRYFKFTGSDLGTYIIRHAPQNNAWELVFYKEPPIIP
ncbi:MAG: hypothetical protein JEZ12_18910 [Desulfobacterium sp.]|nr:hypothetical protein [Desulfobacterium sp.]